MIYTQDWWMAYLRRWLFLNATLEAPVIEQCKEFLLVDIFDYTMPEPLEQLTLLFASLVGI
jgi:aspartyl/asparaginyl beta-hydroxylase (cupin superfamily)